MPPRPLPAVAADLCRATDVDAALRILNDELAGEKQVGLALLRFDARRHALAVVKRTEGGGDDPPVVALDHLPPSVQYAVLAGQRFVEVGDQAMQYARLLGVQSPPDELRLYLKGLVLDGALAAVLVVHDARRRGAARLLERAGPLAALFELAYGRIYEREARFEAVGALHEVTSRLRAEHTSALAALEREVARLRHAGSGESAATAELRAAADRATDRARTAELRLNAVEEQVTGAVDRLQRAHVQLHEQSEVIREQAATIRRLEQSLSAGTAAE